MNSDEADVAECRTFGTPCTVPSKIISLTLMEATLHYILLSVLLFAVQSGDMRTGYGDGATERHHFESRMPIPSTYYRIPESTSEYVGRACKRIRSYSPFSF